MSNKNEKSLETIELTSYSSKIISYEKIIKTHDDIDYSIIENISSNKSSKLENENKISSNKSSKLENKTKISSNKSSII
jgi:hypothetical protein